MIRISEAREISSIRMSGEREVQVLIISFNTRSQQHAYDWWRYLRISIQ